MDAETLPVGPERVLDDNGCLEWAPVDAYFRQSIEYTLRHVAGSSLPDSWKTVTAERLIDQLTVQLLAGLHPVLFNRSVEMGVKAARAELDRLRTADGAS